MKRPKASFQLFDANRQRISQVNVHHPAAKVQAKVKLRLRISRNWPFFTFHNKNFSNLRAVNSRPTALRKS